MTFSPGLDLTPRSTWLTFNNSTLAGTFAVNGVPYTGQFSIPMLSGGSFAETLVSGAGTINSFTAVGVDVVGCRLTATVGHGIYTRVGTVIMILFQSVRVTTACDQLALTATDDAYLVIAGTLVPTQGDGVFMPMTQAALFGTFSAGGFTAPPPPTGGPATNSNQCTATPQHQSTTLGVHTKLVVQQPNPQTTWVCWRVDNAGTGYGGRLEVVNPSATSPGTPSTDTNGGACSTAPGNTVPGTHPMTNGQVEGVVFLFDAYATASQAWVCFQAGSTSQRVLIPVGPVTVPTPPTVTFHPDPGTG